MQSKMLAAAIRSYSHALLAFVFAGAALAQTPATSMDKSAPKGTPAAVQPAPMEKKDAPMQSMQAKGMPVPPGDMRASMMGMMKNMESMKMTGDTDRDFAMMMKMHHQGAIDMAQIELQSGKDPKMRAMAKRIIAAQKKEIKEFEQWLGVAHK